MLITHNGEHHIHRLWPKSATDTFCSCAYCGLIADHRLGRAIHATPDQRTGRVVVIRHCVSCGFMFTGHHWLEAEGEPC